MGLPVVFKDLIRAGVAFETDGERLRWRNSEGRMTPDVVAVLRDHKAEIVDYLKSTHATPAPSRPQPDAFPYGRSVDGKPMTWTGKVVSLDAWRQLSEWDKHGSTGKLFCGVCRAWVASDGFPHCHDTDGGAA